MDECNQVIRGILREVWMRRDPMATAWSSELPVILIGGGGRAEFFQKIVSDLDPWLRQVKHNEGTHSVEVSVPETVCSKTTEYDRLVVAWGLSNQEFNIGEITPANRISDIDPPPVNTQWQARFVDKDQI